MDLGVVPGSIRLLMIWLQTSTFLPVLHSSASRSWPRLLQSWLLILLLRSWHLCQRVVLCWAHPWEFLWPLGSSPDPSPILAASGSPRPTPSLFFAGRSPVPWVAWYGSSGPSYPPSWASSTPWWYCRPCNRLEAWNFLKCCSPSKPTKVGRKVSNSSKLMVPTSQLLWT